MIVDLHCHILPGIDDGSPDVKTSMAMFRRQSEQGVEVDCAAPHYYREQSSIETFCQIRAAALEKLQSALPECSPRVLLAAEVAYFSGISDCIDLDRLCIEGTKTLLLEMPFLQWTQSQIDEVISLVFDRQYQVVLVHPERFCFVDANLDYLSQLAALDIGLQVNTNTLIHWRTRRDGLDFLQMAQVPLLGSDCHNLTNRSPNLARAREIVRKKLGEVFLEEIDQNAEAMLREVRFST